MKGKQILALFLAAMLALSLIGCGERTPSAETNTAQGEQQLPEEAPETPEAPEKSEAPDEPAESKQPEETEEPKESEEPEAPEESEEPGTENESKR